MTRNLIIVLAAMVALALGAATASGENGYAITPQVGANTSDFSENPQGGDFEEFLDLEHKSRIGYQFGAYLRYGDRLYVMPGVFWHRIGIELQSLEEVEGSKEVFKNNINTIQVPFLGAYDIVQGSTVDVRVFAGVAVDIVVSVDETEYFSKDDLRKSSWSAKVGAGMDLIDFITVDLFLDYGFTKFFQSDFQGEGVQHDGQLYGVGLNVGLKFPL